MVRPFWFARTEIFRNKRFVLKGTPKFPNGISERKCAYHLPFETSSRPYANFYVRHGLRHVGCVNMASAENSVFQCMQAANS